MFSMRLIDKELLEAMGCSDGIKKAKALMEQGASINIVDIGGWTPLHHAADCGQVKNIAWLLNQGLDINLRTYSGRTPLNLADSANEVDAVNFLRMKGGEY